MDHESSTRQGAPEGAKPEFAAEDLVAKLKKALGKDGDFPASAKVVAELRQLASDPNSSANQITEIILKEPSLGARVLHTVNSSFYHRGTPIMTVSQAVMRLGMKTLADLCAGLVLLQKFVPASRRGGSFAICLRKMVVTSLLSATVTSEANKAQPGAKTNESGYLAGALAELGTLLLAYYFPNVFDNALKRSETKHQNLARSIFEITGITPVTLSLEILDALNLPQFYKDVLKASENVQLSTPTTQNERALSPMQADIQRCARSLKVAQAVSEVLTFNGDKREIDAILGSVKNIGFDDGIVRRVLGDLPESFRTHCNLIEIDLPALPDFVATYSEPEAGEKKDERSSSDPFKQFVEEIRQAVESREPTASIITSVMETLAWGLKFDRVLLLLLSPNKTSLVGRMLLGASDIDPKKISRTIGRTAPPKACEALAFHDSRPVFRGTAVLDGGWPFAAIPIGSGARTIGVIYSDHVGGKHDELSSREQAAISVLSELLERSVNAQT